MTRNELLAQLRVEAAILTFLRHLTTTRRSILQHAMAASADGSALRTALASLATQHLIDRVPLLDDEVVTLTVAGMRVAEASASERG